MDGYLLKTTITDIALYEILCHIPKQVKGKIVARALQSYFESPEGKGMVSLFQSDSTGKKKKTIEHFAKSQAPAQPVEKKEYEKPKKVEQVKEILENEGVAQENLLPHEKTIGTLSEAQSAGSVKKEEDNTSLTQINREDERKTDGKNIQGEKLAEEDDALEIAVATIEKTEKNSTQTAPIKDKSIKSKIMGEF